MNNDSLMEFLRVNLQGQLPSRQTSDLREHPGEVCKVWKVQGMYTSLDPGNICHVVAGTCKLHGILCADVQ